MRRMKRLLAAATLFLASIAFAWAPPPNPDPQAILRGAVEDRIAGRYEDALAKHEWFQREALKVQPSLYGVRSSFALAWWAQLGERYAPALESLKHFRDGYGEDVRQGRDPEKAFADFAAINREIDDPLATVALFLETEKRDPALARRLFKPAEEALVDAKYYEIAGRYVDPHDELEHATATYRNMSKRSAPSKDVDLGQLSERYFGTEAGRLVALLVLVNRKPDAEQVAKDALRVSGSDTVKGLVESGLQGHMPEPFISREDRQRMRAAG
jgi:hypothetical protein